MEIELKYLLNDADARQLHSILLRLAGLEPGHNLPLSDVTYLGSRAERNHYFQKTGDVASLIGFINGYFDAGLEGYTADRGPISTRTRGIINGFDGSEEVQLVVKQSAHDPENGASRFESTVRIVDLSQGNLDWKLQSQGLVPLAKWSRARNVYTGKTADGLDVELSLSFNAGYGWVLEIEAAQEHADALTLIERLGRKLVNRDPVDPALLNAMYMHYNQHWMQYYGTRKTFVIADIGDIASASADAALRDAAAATLASFDSGEALLMETVEDDIDIPDMPDIPADADAVVVEEKPAGKKKK